MNHFIRSASWTLALCMSLTACGASAVSVPVDEGTPESAPPTTTPTTSTPPSQNPADAPAPARVTGEVYVTQWLESPNFAPQAWASFWRTQERSISRGCRTSVVAGCEVRRCDPGVEREPTPPTAVASAGEVHIDGLSVGGLDLHPGSAEWYEVEAPASFYERRGAWVGGEILTVRADGDPSGAPSFSLSAKAPAPITVTSPSLDLRTLARGADVAIDWTGGGDDDVVRVQVGNPQAEGETVRLRCDVPARDGRVTVPAAALALVRGAANLYVMSIASSRLRSDELDVTFMLKNVARVEAIAVE